MKPFLDIEPYIPDGEAHLMPDGKVYIYGSCDVRDDAWCSDHYYVLSSDADDLSHWEVSPVSFTLDEVPWSKEIRKDNSLANVKCFDDLPKSLKMFMPEEAKQMPIEELLAAPCESAATPTIMSLRTFQAANLLHWDMRLQNPRWDLLRIRASLWITFP